jgi:hypothetical protein
MFTFSNERFFRLSDEEVEIQHNMLLPLREKHERELFSFGTIKRLIASLAISNEWAEKRPATEGSIFYPYRGTLSNMTLGHYSNLCSDLGMNDTSDQSAAGLIGELDYRDHSGGSTRPRSYEFRVDRVDPLGLNGFQGSSYSAGMLITQEAHSITRLDHCLPVEGVLSEDIRLIESQLIEIQAFASENLLTIIDPLTLSEGEGEGYYLGT